MRPKPSRKGTVLWNEMEVQSRAPLSIICTVTCKSTVCWGLSYATFLTGIFGSGCSVNKNYRKNKQNPNPLQLCALLNKGALRHPGRSNKLQTPTNQEANKPDPVWKNSNQDRNTPPQKGAKGRCKTVLRDCLSCLNEAELHLKCS